MRAAFKEWAVVVDALGRGDQIIILRKGGISEGRGGFQFAHEKFFLFPTLFHQQRESVILAAQQRYDQIAPAFPPAEILRLDYFAETVWSQQLISLEQLEHLRGQHIWRDEVLAERFEWGREKAIFALAVKVHRLAKPIDLPMLPAYGGCKSWIDLSEDISISGSQPVLSDSAFAEKFSRLTAALALTPTSPTPTAL